MFESPSFLSPADAKTPPTRENGRQHDQFPLKPLQLSLSPSSAVPPLLFFNGYLLPVLQYPAFGHPYFEALDPFPHLETSVMAETDPKFNPTEENAAGTEPKLDEDATEKVPAGVTDQVKSAADGASEATGAASSAVKDNVFAMFGGGPRKEKKETQDDEADEPSGSSKAQKKEDDVSATRRITIT